MNNVFVPIMVRNPGLQQNLRDQNSSMCCLDVRNSIPRMACYYVITPCLASNKTNREKSFVVFLQYFLLNLWLPPPYICIFLIVEKGYHPMQIPQSAYSEASGPTWLVEWSCTSTSHDSAPRVLARNGLGFCRSRRLTLPPRNRPTNANLASLHMN